MPEHTNTATIAATTPYDNAIEYLSQTQALNLALWTSGDVHEQLKPAFQLMDNLLNHITIEMNKMHRESKGGDRHNHS